MHCHRRAEWRRKNNFAREYLPKVAGVIQFVNADLIAQGLAPLDPGGAAIAAGRLLVREVTRLAAARIDFAFESTLSGLSCAGHLATWKKEGYRIEIAYLRLRSPQLALRRIAARLRQGGHGVPRADVLRRRASIPQCTSDIVWPCRYLDATRPVGHCAYRDNRTENDDV